MNYSIEDLVYLMSRLRAPEDGCPWDKKQSFQTIVPHTLEEVYEVLDAIERQDWHHLEEELGDLLFQVVFYAQLLSERGDSNFSTVVNTQVEKLLRRHPHVFPQQKLYARPARGSIMNDQALNEQWSQIKREEKKTQAAESERILSSVPRSMTALQQANKIQKLAATVGFDWPDVEPVYAAIESEIEEVKTAIDRDHLQEELGDLLFAVVNLVRKSGFDPEQCLHKANRKFELRFDHIEKQVRKSHKDWPEWSLEELECQWQQAKKLGL